MSPTSSALAYVGQEYVLGIHRVVPAHLGSRIACMSKRLETMICKKERNMPGVYYSQYHEILVGPGYD